MDIQAEKLNLIEWIAQINDTSLIRKIKAIKKQKDPHWWNVLAEDQQKDIEAGLKDLDKGKKKLFTKVMAKYK